MSALPVSPATSDAVTGSFRTAATTKGAVNSNVSSQWWSRPDDQKFLSLDDLYAHTKGLADVSHASIVETNKLRVIADRADPRDLRLVNQTTGQEMQPSHYAFTQLASKVEAKPSFLRTLPGTIAGLVLQYKLMHYRPELLKAYARQDETNELRAVTGPDYGRIFDHEIVEAVQRIAGNGTGDTRWKVPGMLDWSSQKGGTVTYNPFVDVTKQTTTLFASDRDVFLFLVDDTHPIEIGKLPNGDPDLVFRGFYAYNSEVGDQKAGLATMYLRGVCCNRMLWGVEGFQEISIRHTKNAPVRFDAEAAPALKTYSEMATSKLLSGITDAKATVVARNDEDRLDFLLGQKFSKGQADAIIASVLNEEQTAPESIWDFVNGITAVARTLPHQDARIEMEKKASRLLARV
ncbi:MAG TPA: DUF932 domain-containing protein [Aliidongia sp.]|uniref:DUF932 domain-containing protein n=1 Tax=Aliidongia sp. TaxID=1914230 RepID=UPI002DDCB6D9|nr:DUF932 domain-containing protein [Aliidongia sp.]HEV2673265.1 DUF932 domain-containing protein [Aliidongia sp.]